MVLSSYKFLSVLNIRFFTQRLGIHISGPGGAESLLKYLYLDPQEDT